MRGETAKIKEKEAEARMRFKASDDKNLLRLMPRNPVRIRLPANLEDPGGYLNNLIGVPLVDLSDRQLYETLTRIISMNTDDFINQAEPIIGDMIVSVMQQQAAESLVTFFGKDAQPVLLGYIENITASEVKTFNNTIFLSKAMEALGKMDTSADANERALRVLEANYTKIAQSILVYEPSSFENQSETIESLENYITDKTKMIVIDTITTQYRRSITEKGEKNIRLNKILNRQLALLKDLTIRKDIITIITNQVRGAIKDKNAQNGIEPVASSILNFWADYEILLKFPPNREMSKRQAVLIKHPSNSDRPPVELRLSDEGFQDT